MSNTIITPQIFSKEVIRNLDRETVLLAHTNRQYEGDLSQAGDTVRVQTLPTITFTASSVTGAGDFTNGDVGTGPGGTISASDFTITLENLVVDKYTEKLVKLTDHQLKQSNLSLEEAVAARFAEGLARLLDSEVVSQILTVQVADIPAANKLDSGAPITLTTSNIYSSIMALRAALRKQNVPVKNMRLFVGVDAESLLQQSTFLVGSGMAADVMENGSIGRVGQVPVYVTTALDASKELIMMAEGAVNCVVQVNQSKVAEGTDGFYKNVMAGAIYGMKIFGENAKAIAIQYVA